jgi:hypothetical protein
MEERRRGIDPFSKRGLAHSLTPSLKGSHQDLMNVDDDVQKEFVKAMKTDDLD